MNNRAKGKWGAGILVLFLSFITAGSVWAFDARADEDVLIPAGEVIQDDLYATGNRIVIEGTIDGDLVAIASEVVVNGTVTGDLLAAAQSVTINGLVEDDVRAMGYMIEIGSNGVIGDDLVGGAYSVVTGPGSNVNGDVLFAGVQAHLGGDVGEDVLVFCNSLKIEGQVGSDVEAYLGVAEQPAINPMIFMPNIPPVETVDPGLSLGPNATIGGNLAYRAPLAAEIPAGSVAGEVVFEQTVPAQPDIGTSLAQDVSGFLTEFVQRFIFTSLVGLLMVWLLPQLVHIPVYIIRERPWPSLLWGIGAYIVFPLSLILIAFVFILLGIILNLLSLGSLATGIILTALSLLGMVLILFALILLYVTKVIIGDLTGQAILHRIMPSIADDSVWPMLLGVLIISFLVSIPYIGMVINFAVMLFGLGAFVLMRYQGGQPAAVVAN